MLTERTISLKDFILKLNSHCLVITANQRLSNHIRLLFDRYQQENNLSIWESLNSQSLESWLVNFGKIFLDSIILSASQEQVLWQSIINANTWNSQLLSIHEISLLIQKAWKLIHDWEIADEVLNQYRNNEQIQYFLTCSEIFKEYCQQHNFCSQAEMAAQLLELDHNDFQTLKKNKFYLVGFDELSPIVKKLFNKISTITDVQVINIHGNAGFCHRMNCETQEEEINHFISFAYSELQKKPEIKIGCIVPELASCRLQIEKVLLKRFSQEIQVAELPYDKLPFNISASQSLLNYPIISVASEILEMLSGQITIEKIGSLLQSPYLSTCNEDVDLGALIDSYLREFSYSRHLPIDHLIQIIQQVFLKNPFFSKAAGKLASRLQKFNENQNNHEKNLYPSEWAIFFLKQLTHLGWPGTRTKNSFEFQIIERWQQLLNEMVLLDPLIGKVELQQALLLLKSILQKTSFQPLGNLNAPIQVLGILESTGYEFDFLWIMGLHDENWPKPPKPNPFIPYELQKSLKMPNASAIRQFNYTQKIQQRLLASGSTIILSSPLKEGEKSLRSSPLIENIPVLSIEKLSINKTLNIIDLIFESKALEITTDPKAPPILTTQLIKGGSKIFSEQSTCPFRAFARLRLKAEPLPLFHFAINEQRRGVLLHASLSQIWNELNNQTELKKLTEQELKSLISKCVSQSVAVFSSKNCYKESFLETLLILECKTLERIIFQWLQLEKERRFFKVIANEQKYMMDFAGIRFNIQIDRIDELEDGTHFIIDYKTGSNLTSVKSWLEPRNSNPQLPLYSLIEKFSIPKTPTIINALAYGLLRSGFIQFKGICSDAVSNLLGNEIKGIIPINSIKKINEESYSTWQQQKQEWEIALNSLATDFKQGKADTDPIQGYATCQQCHFGSLCRQKNN